MIRYDWSMLFGMVLLVTVAVVLATVGLLMLSSATIGVGLIAVGCLLAILARLVQASLHHHHTRAADHSDRIAA